jgi:hypothetical protein
LLADPEGALVDFLSRAEDEADVFFLPRKGSMEHLESEISKARG